MQQSASNTCANTSLAPARRGPKAVGASRGHAADRLSCSRAICSSTSVQGQTSKSAIVSDTSFLRVQLVSRLLA